MSSCSDDDGQVSRPAGNGPDDWEAAAADAAEWLEGCRMAAARGDPDHAVGAGPIAEPALARAVELLSAGVEALLDLDAAGCDGRDLLETMVAGHDLAQRLTVGLGQTMLAYQGSGEWRLKARSSPCRIAHRTRQSVSEPRALLHLGDDLARMPEVAQAAQAGEIHVSHVRKLGRLAANDRTREAFQACETDLVAAARTLGWHQFCRKVDEWVLEHDPDGAEQNASTNEANRRVHLSDGLDSTGLLDGQLTPVGNATVRGALDHFYEELFQEEWDDARDQLGREPTVADLARTPAQRRHDALQRLAEQAMARLDGTRPTPLISFVSNFDGLADRVSLLEQTGTVIPPGTLARLIAERDVLFEHAVFDVDNQNRVGLSDRRLFTGKLRRKIQLRDQSCTWPGCDQPAVNCQVDHVREWSEGGTTSLDNGQPHCRAHNLLKERVRKLNRRRLRRRTHQQGSGPPAS